MPNPLCFVLMPFRRKPSGQGGLVDFDAIYQEMIKPAIHTAEMEPIRVDEEQVGGVIHKPMFERLILCEYAIADLTTANANVFYELGVRHAVRPYSTVLIFAEGVGQMPFDVGPLRALPYKLGADGRPAEVDRDGRELAECLRKARVAKVDSPIFQFLTDYPNIDHTKTDIFREQVQYSARMKQALAEARRKGVAAVREVEGQLGRLEDTEAGVVVDLFLSYRAAEVWNEMIRLAEHMPPPLAATVMVRAQLGLALNRSGRGEEAEQVLLTLIEQRGPSSETYGILGRVYKDSWEAARVGGKPVLARGLLRKAIDAYVCGFEANWRDAYPGINALTLMEVEEHPDPRQAALLPVVRYSLGRRLAAGMPDYWDYATLLELAVLERSETEAADALSGALACVRESWEPKTTMRNLRLIRAAREKCGENVLWIKEIETTLADRAREISVHSA